MITYRVASGPCMACNARGAKMVHLAFGPQRGPRLAEVTLCRECLQDLHLAAGNHLRAQLRP